jgi:mono/diheme cytochrome c family protein
VAAATTALAADDAAVFREKIEPVMRANCAGCHTGPQAQGGLSLANFADLMKGGKRGPSLQPGKSSASLLMQFVRGERNPRMPLGGKPLPDTVVTALAAAIDSLTPGVQEQAAKAGHAEWVFKTPIDPATPKPRNATWVKNPIDAFVLAKLEAQGFAPAPAASKRALLRRVYYDLIGLPPTEEEARAFLNDPAADAYEKLIDKLLADRRYGERWARHWLDLVRFAESDGFAIDGERPTAWRYRDYVIRAFNDDKPYDEFVLEQLAGDELQRRPATRGGNIENEGLIAVGFLRMGPWERDTNFDAQLRLDWLNEMAGTTSQVFLGLTAGCARCHDHKYDPIPQKDFYRLQAFFAATRIEERPMPHLESEGGRLELRKRLRQLEDDQEAANEAVRALEKTLKAKLAPAGKREDEFQKLLGDKGSPVFTAEERARHKDTAERAAKIGLEMARYQPIAYSVNEVAPPAVMDIEPTYVLAGGERIARGEQVEPGFLKAITGNSDPAKIAFPGRYRSGRRKALAEWIVSPANPLTARVMANRLWQHHFGEGIVRTPSDFGLNGERPSHPELLDWLALRFIEKKWSIKAMHRLMLTSNTYRQATRHPDERKIGEADPGNRLLSRMNWMRLESEALRDSMLMLSGGLNRQTGGPGMFFGVKDEIAQGFQMFKWYASDEQAQRKRSVYAFQRRSLPMPLMEVFDAANMSESCARRGTTTVSPQALTLLNGEFTAVESRRFAGRVIELAGPDPARQIAKAFSLALQREPLAAELDRARGLYSGREPLDALTRLATVLFNLNEFLYLE